MNKDFMKQRISGLLSAGVITSALLLQACGSGSSGDAGPTVTGSVTLNGSLAQDSDVNDSTAEYRSNNLPSSAQVLSTNVLTLQGFASAEGTQVQGSEDPTGQRFFVDADPDDYFEVTLQAGQRILLQVADYTEKNLEGSYTGDLDLYLFEPDQPLATASSTSTDASESITVPYDGTFLINVYAYEGISKYNSTSSRALSALMALTVALASAHPLGSPLLVRALEVMRAFSG